MASWELAPLLAPRSVAVVGASARPGSYGNQVLANLAAGGFAGPVYGVHPTATEVHGWRCVPRLADLPHPCDAVVVATPAATVPGLLAEAAAAGAGGAVVFAAGFAETPAGRSLQDRLRAAALAHRLPVCGPNGNGIVSVPQRAALWGDSCTLGPAGPVAVISQSGNLAVNALASARGLRLHTVVSGGNQAVLDAADYLAAVAALDGVRAVALYLEDAGDGAKLATALAACAERDIGVAVLKAGASPLGATAAAAHTGSVAGDSRALRALVTEAGGAWCTNPHQLLEVVKALGHARRFPAAGTVIVTCSGGDAAVAADEAARLGVPLPAPGPATAAALAGVLPATARPGNPLDYTAVIFGERDRTADVVAIAGGDDGVGPVLVYHDRPGGLAADAAAEWDAALAGIVAGAARLDKPVLVAATLPELMPPETAAVLLDAGLVPINGLTEGVLAAGALLRPVGDPQRLRAIASVAARGPAGDGRWLAEGAAKDLLRAAGVPTPDGRTVDDPEAAVLAARQLRGPVAVKLSAPGLRHKTELGAVRLNLVGDAAVRAAATRLRALPGAADARILVEAMAAPGAELLVAVRRDGPIPVLVLATGGTWVEVLDDAVLLPLPVDAAAVRAGLHRLRGAALLTGARGTAAADLPALCRLVTAAAAAAVDADLALVELNPVVAGPDGAIAVDAVVRHAG